LNAGGHGDQSFLVFGQKFFVNARLVIKPFQMGFGDQFHQVAVACFVFHQQNQMVARVVNLRPARKAAFQRDINFTPDDRLDAAFFSLFVKFHRAIHIAVIGDCAGAHPQSADFVQQRINLCQSIQQTVMGVGVEMDEIHSKNAKLKNQNKKLKQYALRQLFLPDTDIFLLKNIRVRAVALAGSREK
jgi:hypothetical protein